MVTELVRFSNLPFLDIPALIKGPSKMIDGKVLEEILQVMLKK